MNECPVANDGIIKNMKYLSDVFYDIYPSPILAFGYCRCLRLCVCLAR